VRVHGGPGAVLVVENTGPVVGEAEAATLTRAFVRGAGPARVAGGAGGGGQGTGRGDERHSGLGLAIVASVAAAHGWPLSVEPRAEGGLRVTVG